MARSIAQEIADGLRAAIESGDLPPGALLPSERELIERYSVSKTTVAKAIAILRSAGLVTTTPGRGVFVPKRPPVRRISSERYRADAGPQAVPQTSFTTDQGITWEEYRLDKAYRWIEADERLADLFGVEPGCRVLERRFVFYAKGEPSQMSRTCLLASDVEGTPVADPDREPWPGGNIAQLRTLGLEVDDITESVASRMPTPEEATALRIGSGIPVLAITRRMLAGGRVIEVADPIVIPADRAILDYRIQLAGSE
ncbi:GntR family transcriptional regulator [Streptosporangium sp. NPDC048865]|uniref:GntR family transcriptional regulator n=1 Tax=Streptosporangium sp. NPDC048865 TaxID=3155766 RepID=UPI0034323DE2